MEKIKVVLAGTFRPIFHGDMKSVLAHSIAALQQKSVDLGFDFLPIPRGMETLTDAEEVARTVTTEGADLVVIQNSSFADGDMILPFFSVPASLAVWAVEETTASGPLPLNSFCATNLYMSIAGRFNRGYNRPVKWLYGDADTPAFSRRFDTTIRALTAARNLRTSKLLMIGDTVPGYHDVVYDEKAIRSLFGVSVERLDLNEFYREYDAAPANGALTEKVSAIERESAGIKVSRDDLQKSARAETAFENIIARHNATAITFRCWPEVPGKIGLMVCSTIGRLNQSGVVAATETDVLGAVSMLALKYLSGRETVLMDLSAWDPQSDAIYIWHCGNIPADWFDNSGFVLAHHFNRDTIGVVREGKMKSWEVTALRFMEHDASAFLATGRFQDRTTPMYKGCSAWMSELAINGQRVASRDFMNTLLVNAIPHHLAYVDKDLTTDVNELCAWLGIRVMNPLKYQDFLQRPTVE